MKNKIRKSGIHQLGDLGEPLSSCQLHTSAWRDWRGWVPSESPFYLFHQTTQLKELIDSR